MISEAIVRRAGLYSNLGKTITHLLHPNDFELYLFALELIQLRTGKTLAYFVFPISPQTISVDKTQRVSIVSTQGGTTVFRSPVFEPLDFSVQGSFGRDFKILLGDVYTPLTSGFTSFKKLAGQFDAKLKTGYGCLKILEDIIEQTALVDEQGARGLIMYNFMMNQRYYVQPMNLKFTQDPQSNMIWNYNLSLKLVASIESVRGQGESDALAKRYAATAAGQQIVNSALKFILK